MSQPVVPSPATARLERRRILRRMLAFALTLVAVDGLVRQWAPTSDFDGDYRLPDDAEVVLLPALIGHLKAVHRQGSPVVAVIGSSPTWGTHIRDPHRTVPAVLERELRRRLHRSIEVYNLSAKGFLIGDQAFVARAVARQVDAVVLQLNYHTFAPAIADGVRLRHPELPTVLDLPVDADDARRLRLATTPPGNLNAAVRPWLRRHWAFYRERDRLTVGWLGTTPATWLHRLAHPPGRLAADEADAPFDDLPPARQTMIMKRYGPSVAFTLSPDNTELRTLDRLMTDLAAVGTPTFSYLSPLNRDALDDFQAMPWDRYRRNAAHVARVATRGGGWFRDYNAGPVLVPGDEFYDVSHTLDAGGDRFGRRLAADLAPWLRLAGRRRPSGAAP